MSKLGINVLKQDATWQDTTKVGVIKNDQLVEDIQNPNAEYDFAWSSSNENVATIDGAGNITVLAKGTVYFTLTALNGDLTWPATETETEKKTWWSVDTLEITVGVGNSPFLTVPESVRTVQVREGMDATVVWSTNLTEKNRDYALGKGDMSEEQANALETTYTIQIYSDTNFDVEKGEPSESAKLIHEGTTESSMADVRSSYTIPAGTLSYSPDPYYAVISSTYEGTLYSDWAKIQVLSPPAVITLERPESLFITDDTKSLNLNWTLENFNSTGGEFELTITNSSKPNEIKTHNETGNTGDSYSMTIDPVTNGYRDVYTVQVAAKNAEDSTWSYDSFVLYVYDRTVLEIIYVDPNSVDGHYDGNGNLTLTNQEKEYITALASAQENSTVGSPTNSGEAQTAVWDNREDIALTADISMDPSKPWLEVPDQFAWNATDEEGNQEGEKTHATINYQQGALYEDITRYTERTSYGPLSEFRLSGLSDGTTNVTATHVNTGTAAELAVKVDTLKDKLYLFQISPTQLDTLTLKYTNGDKVDKNVTGIEGGKVAVYEESGIQGDVYIEGVDNNNTPGDPKDDVTYFGTIYHEDLVSSEKDSTQLELYPVNYMTLRKAAQVPIYLKEPDGTPYTGSITVHAGVYVNDVYASGAKIDTNDNQGHDGVAGYTIESLGTDGSHTFTFDMTQFDTEGRDVSEDPIGPDDNVQFVFQIEAEGFKPLLVRVNSAVNEEDAIAAGDRIITLTEAPADEPKSPFAAQQTLYYGENKYGYSSDVLGVKGKLGPGDTYQSVELETMTLWWGQEKDATALKMEIQDEYRMPPKNQSCEVVDYPFTTMPVTRHSLKLNKETMTGWLDTLDSTRIDMVYSVNNKETKREDPSFRIINMLGSGDVSTWDRLGAMMNDTAKAGKLSNGKGEVSVSNALVTLGISMATSFGLSADSLTMKVVPTEDPTVFRGIFLIGLNNMIGDNVSKIDPDTSQVDDLDYMPGREDLTKLVSMGTEGYFQDQANRIDNAQKLLKNNVSTKSKGNDYSYMLKGGFETEIYYDYDARQWKMVVVTGQLNVGGGFGQTWCFNSFCGPVPITAELGYGIALSVQFAAAVDRTVMLNDYLTLIQLNAFIRAFAGIGFDYAILAMKIGLFGQLSFEGALKVLNAKNTSGPTVGYNLSFDGEVGIEFLVRFLFISYERILWSMKIPIYEGKDKDNNWEKIDEYWEGVKNGKSDNQWQMITGPETQALRSTQQAELLAADSTTGTALYASPSTATLESRDYLDNPRTYGSTMTMLRARANTLSGEETGGNEENLIENAYPAGEPMVSEDGKLLAFVHDFDSPELEETQASYVVGKEGQEGLEIDKNGSNIKPFPDPKTTPEGEGDGGVSTQASNSDQVVGGDSQLRLAGTSEHAVAAWTRVTETLKKEPGSAVTSDEQMLMMNSTEIFASVRNVNTNNGHDGWVTTQLTENGSADMAPAVATNGSKALVAWRAVAASDSGKVTTFDTNDTILYRIYEDEKWSETYTLYNGTSGAVKGIEAQMMTDGSTMAVAYTIDKEADKSNNGSSTTAEEETDGNGTYLLSDLQTVIAIIQENTESTQDDGNTNEPYKVTTNVQVTNDNDVNENPQLTVVKFPANGTAGQTEEETFVLGWYSIHDEDGVQKNDIRLVAMNKNGAIRGDFVDSLSAINSQVGSTITSTFRFVKNADGLGSLSILWSQPTLEADKTVFEDDDETRDGQVDEDENRLGDADGDVLMGVRFRVEDGELVGLTAPIQLTSMAESCTIESFDGWLQEDKSIKAVVLSTQYGVKDEKGDTFHVEEIPGVGDDELQKVYIQNEQTNLRLITGQYEDTISVDTPLPDYEALLAGTDIIPIQTTVTNMGTQAITSLTFTVGEGENASSVTLDDEDGLNLQPGESQILTVNYEVKKDANNQITCPEYSVSATFGAGTTVTEEGSAIYLNVPSLGVSQVETVQQAEGDRVIQFSLYNLSPSKLENSGRQVKVGLFTDADCTNQVSNAYVTFKKVETLARNGDGTFTVSGDNDLALIDQGGYLLQATVHLQKYANENDKDNGYLEEKEIRENGINFYVKAWVADKDGNELGEVHTGDNVRAVTFQSLLELTGQEFTTTADLTQENGKTKVDLTIQNNSLQSVNASGDEMKKVIYVNLLDENGNVLETQETDNIATWDPEGSQNLQLDFEKAGTQVSYFFGDRTTGPSGELSNITLDKIPFQFEKGQTNFTVQAPQDLEETVLGLAFASGTATATVNGKPYDVNENRTISLGSGTTVINIVVTDEDGTTKNYQITITKGNTGGGGTVTCPTYPPVIPDAEHGSVSVNPTRPHQGDKVTITATPDEGYVVGKVTVTKANGEKVAVTDLGNGKYTFTQPSGKVTIDVTFIPEGWPFVDVVQGDWYYDAVKYVYEHSIMVGMSGTTFEPETSLNRGMVVQMLYNLEGKPAVTSENPFTDVHSTQWWYDAVRWGAANEVVAGYGDGKFLPEQNISRQEFAQMLYNYAKYKGYDLTAAGDLSKFPDGDETASWAKTALSWANGFELINGFEDETLRPQATTTRAQAASILMKFDQNVTK